MRAEDYPGLYTVHWTLYTTLTVHYYGLAGNLTANMNYAPTITMSVSRHRQCDTTHLTPRLTRDLLGSVRHVRWESLVREEECDMSEAGSQ